MGESSDDDAVLGTEGSSEAAKRRLATVEEVKALAIEGRAEPYISQHLGISRSTVYRYLSMTASAFRRQHRQIADRERAQLRKQQEAEHSKAQVAQRQQKPDKAKNADAPAASAAGTGSRRGQGVAQLTAPASSSSSSGNSSVLTEPLRARSAPATAPLPFVSSSLLAPFNPAADDGGVIRPALVRRLRLRGVTVAESGPWASRIVKDAPAPSISSLTASRAPAWPTDDDNVIRPLREYCIPRGSLDEVLEKMRKGELPPPRPQKRARV
jgi:hypothetical protein